MTSEDDLGGLCVHDHNLGTHLYGTKRRREKNHYSSAMTRNESFRATFELIDVTAIRKTGEGLKR